MTSAAVLTGGLHIRVWSSIPPEMCTEPQSTEEPRSRCGTVYQLMPSNGGWVENVLVNFDGANGSGPFGNLIIDASGNLYGTTLVRRTRWMMA